MDEWNVYEGLFLNLTFLLPGRSSSDKINCCTRKWVTMELKWLGPKEPSVTEPGRKHLRLVAVLHE